MRKALRWARSLHLPQMGSVATLALRAKEAREDDCEYACTLPSAPGAGYRHHHECDAFPLPERMLLWGNRATSARVVRAARPSPSARSSQHDTRRTVRSPDRSSQYDRHGVLARHPSGALEYSAHARSRRDDTPPRARAGSERSCSLARTTAAASCTARRRQACRRVDRGSRCNDSSELVRFSSPC